MLGWTQRELAEAAGVSAQTIKFFENGRNEPRDETLDRLREAFERRGIVFTNGDKPSVTLDPSKAIIPA
jgi:transcriptional regulator with XRE-family HTH domain